MPNFWVFRAFNTVYGKVGSAASEESVLALLYSVNAYLFCYMQQKHSYCSHTTGSPLNSQQVTPHKNFSGWSPSVGRKCQHIFNFLHMESQK